MRKKTTGNFGNANKNGLGSGELYQIKAGNWGFEKVRSIIGINVYEVNYGNRQ